MARAEILDGSNGVVDHINARFKLPHSWPPRSGGIAA
jgi:hypothetical protein